MKIETKFSIGDSVWVMKENRPYNFVVRKIRTSTFELPTGCNYGVERKTTISYADDSPRFSSPESACFASKEELLASL